MLEISPTAVAEIHRIERNRQTPIYLRLMVKPGGCQDFYYDLAWESAPTEDSESATQSDLSLEINGISLIVDRQSWEYVRELKLDYAEDLMGGGFRFHNPQHRKTCGCGISFAPSKPR